MLKYQQGLGLWYFWNIGYSYAKKKKKNRYIILNITKI